MKKIGSLASLLCLILGAAAPIGAMPASPSSRPAVADGHHKAHRHRTHGPKHVKTEKKVEPPKKH